MSEVRLIDANALKKKIQGVVENEMPIDEKWALGLRYSLKLIDNTSTVDLKDIYQEGHYDGHLEGYTKAINEERPQGECQNYIHKYKCDIYNENPDNCKKCDRRSSTDKRPQGEWIVTAEDSEGIHRIQCPFCGYEKGSDFIDYITVTFEKFPPFCESCGAELRGKIK